MPNPLIYEINARVWLQRFKEQALPLTLDRVPISYWRGLAEMGVEYVWLMGVWETCPRIVKRYCFSPELVSSYAAALADFQQEDVCGSPYSVNSYTLNPILGSEEGLLSLRSALNQLGIGLILDFIPNHFSAGTDLLRFHPEIFLPGSLEQYEKDPHTFFEPDSRPDSYFAHGKDPNFPAWTDTVQVNYASERARRFMRAELLRISRLCDGVRCDMAMLPLNEVFQRTWGELALGNKCFREGEEFWPEAIQAVKHINPEFIFIAEAYWDLEWELQQLGFDFTYDKKFYDRLRAGGAGSVREHLLADALYQQKSVRFVENHDEPRVVSAFGENKSMAAALVAMTVQGMRFINDGQCEGRQVRLPVQLCREPRESPNLRIQEFYRRLLSAVNHDVFHRGTWRLCQVQALNDFDQRHRNILSWEWVYGSERRLVVVNYGEEKAAGHIKLGIPENGGRVQFRDLLNDVTYSYTSNDISRYGLYIELDSYSGHLFSF